MVGIGLGQVLLQESEVLVGRLASGLGGSGSLGGGRLGERGLLSVEFGQFGSEVRGQRWGLGGLGRAVASDAAGSVGGLVGSV